MNNVKNELANWLAQNGDGKLKIKKFIGKGGFSTCWLLRYRNEENGIALKVMKKEKLKRNEKIYAFREFVIHGKLKHEYIVEFKRYAYTDKLIFMFLEHCNRGSLADFISSKQPITKDMIKIFSWQLVSALSYIKKCHVIHRDVKLSNLLLNQDSSGKYVVKLGDFGFSIFTPYDKPQESVCGTKKYMAPEMIDKTQYYTYPVDIWSLGIVLYILFVGEGPYDKTMKEIRKISANEKNRNYFEQLYLLNCINSKQIHYPNSLRENEKNFLSVCLQKNQNIRATPDLLQKHKYFQ